MGTRDTFGRRSLLPTLYILFFGILLVNLLGTVSYRVSALEINITARVAVPGSTRVVLPPLGELRATTHPTPLALVFELRSIDYSILQVLSGSDGEALLLSLKEKAARALLLFGLKLVFLSGLGGAIALYLLGFSARKSQIKGFFLASVFMALLLVSTYSLYDLSAFESPSYHGVLQAAPWMLSLLQEGALRVEELGTVVRSLSDNLYSFFQQIEALSPIHTLESDRIVLHVSDIHNNPVGYRFVSQIVESFNVDMIVDTGDLTDWGTPLEARIIEQILALGIPYVFVSGNHDAPEVLRKMQEVNQVYVLDNGETEILGLRIAGVGDLAADSHDATPPPIATLHDVAEKIKEKYEKRDHGIDLFLVHNHRIATRITPGIFPVILFGHNHVQSIQVGPETVYINAGTTGAAGLRGVVSKEPIPFSLALLYYRMEEPPKLLAVDGITVQGLRASILLDRRFIEKSRN